MTQRRIDQLTAAIEAHGYLVIMNPTPGEEAAFAAALAGAFGKIERTLAANANRYGFRGRSRRALAALHFDLPQPCWGVEVSTR